MQLAWVWAVACMLCTPSLQHTIVWVRKEIEQLPWRQIRQQNFSHNVAEVATCIADLRECREHQGQTGGAADHSFSTTRQKNKITKNFNSPLQ
jgi:hypothetical protein